MNGNDIVEFEEKHHQKLTEEFIDEHIEEYEQFVTQELAEKQEVGNE